VNKTNHLVLALLLCTQLMLTACSPIKTQDSNQYTLGAFSDKKLVKTKTKISILVSQPEAMAGNQTEQMHYIQKPFELSAFVRNTWVSSPANMLYPLITQSLQKTGYFFAVASGPYVDRADYRLDTQLIALRQNFLAKPSVVELVAKVMLTHIEDNRVISSRVISQRISCPTDTPYGGVLAANKATQAFTASVSEFVISQVKLDILRTGTS
jgi:cholesterol transport system auxiliary component